MKLSPGTTCRVCKIAWRGLTACATARWRFCARGRPVPRRCTPYETVSDAVMLIRPTTTMRDNDSQRAVARRRIRGATCRTEFKRKSARQEELRCEYKE